MVVSSGMRARHPNQRIADTRGVHATLLPSRDRSGSTTVAGSEYAASSPLRTVDGHPVLDAHLAHAVQSATSTPPKVRPDSSLPGPFFASLLGQWIKEEQGLVHGRYLRAASASRKFVVTRVLQSFPRECIKLIIKLGTLHFGKHPQRPCLCGCWRFFTDD